MRTSSVAGAKTRLAHLVGHIEEMQTMIGTGCLEERPHPGPHSDRVRRKIQYDRDPETQQILNMRTDGLAQSP